MNGTLESDTFLTSCNILKLSTFPPVNRAHSIPTCYNPSDKPSINGPRREKTCLLWFANNKGADQPAHPRRLISAFVIRVLESIISKLATSENFDFLASLYSRGDWFESRFVGNPEDRVCRRPNQHIKTYLTPFPRTLDYAAQANSISYGY